MNEQNRPAYYAIIPSKVRYCEELKFAERLLYGEITALTGKEGYCFATNKYFSELYGVISGTISRWISHLEQLGFIQIEIIKNEKQQIIERRIYINDNYREFLDTYKQNKQYPYEQNCLYPISKKAKYNNINNNKIDRFFYYIIKREKENPEKMTYNQTKEFFELLEKFEFNYTEDMMHIFTKENMERIKIIIFAMKELSLSHKKILLSRANRSTLIFVYDKCKNKQEEYRNTEKEIQNFFEYYYISLIKELEKS